MLVLSRKKDEQLVIGGNVTIRIVKICGDKVRLGIEAPANVSVHRQEVFDALHGPRPITLTEALRAHQKKQNDNSGGDPANEVDATAAGGPAAGAEGTEATPPTFPPSGETTWEN